MFVAKRQICWIPLFGLVFGDPRQYISHNRMVLLRTSRVVRSFRRLSCHEGSLDARTDEHHCRCIESRYGHRLGLGSRSPGGVGVVCILRPFGIEVVVSMLKWFLLMSRTKDRS